MYCRLVRANPVFTVFSILYSSILGYTFIGRHPFPVKNDVVDYANHNIKA